METMKDIKQENAKLKASNERLKSENTVLKQVLGNIERIAKDWVKPKEKEPSKDVNPNKNPFFENK